MNRVYVDEVLQSKLDELRTEAELCGKDGHLLGYFIPVVPSDREIYDWAEAQTSDEEIERRRREPGGKTTAELLEYLRTL
jgi:hypothetical protein